MRVVAIVLAGGRSSRFGRDKLAELVDGRALLDLAIEAVRPVADEVLVVVAPDATPAVSDGVRLVHDRREFEGPLAAVAVALAASEAEVGVIVGGDMPSLVTAVLRRMVASLGQGDAVVLEHGGHHRPLPLVVRRPVALETAEARLAAGDRRLRALPESLDAAVLAETVWRQDDPEGDTIRDIDTPDDLP